MMSQYRLAAPEAENLTSVQVPAIDLGHRRRLLIIVA